MTCCCPECLDYRYEQAEEMIEDARRKEMIKTCKHGTTTPTARTTLCWNCNTVYPIVDMQYPSCGATNANRDPETAATEVRAKAKTPNA